MEKGTGKGGCQYRAQPNASHDHVKGKVSMKRKNCKKKIVNEKTTLNFTAIKGKLMK